MTAISTLINKLIKNNYKLSLKGDRLLVEGPNRPEWHAEIRKHKPQLIEALKTYGQDVAYIEDRLRKGMEWLVKAWNMPRDKDSPALVAAFSTNLIRWGDLEDMLRDQHVEYKGCPLGGCDKSQPVMCRECMI